MPPYSYEWTNISIEFRANLTIEEIGLPSLFRNSFFLAAISAIIFSGCAATIMTKTSSDASGNGESFSNFLVIGVAGDYNSRAQFERTVVSGIRAKGNSARAFYSVVGGNKPITRELVMEAISSGGFDAVVLTRVLDTDAELDVRSTITGAKITRKDGGLLDMFRYDYEEMDEPMSLNINTRITFAIEVYDAATESLVWSGESRSRRSEHIGILIDDTAEFVVNQLDRNNLIGR